MEYILLIVGFVLLIKGADIFVDGAAAIAKKLGIPGVIVGLTIVSLGTSAPELSVSIISSLQGNNDIAIGNVLGSNIFNTIVVIGTTAIIVPLLIKKDLIKKDFFISIGITGLLLFVAFDSIIFGKENIISRIDGIILLIVGIIYTAYLIYTAKKSDVQESDEDVDSIKISKSIILSIIGVIGIVVGGKLVVDSAKEIAITFGMSEKLVGLTIVAIGTSLPELVTSAVAAFKGKTDIALGNVLGSNIFNIVLIIGLSATISPIAVAGNLIFDILFLIAATVIIGILVFTGKGEGRTFTKVEGIALVAMYIGYIAYIVIRN